jgi:hypothetical protein
MSRFYLLPACALLALAVGVTFVITSHTQSVADDGVQYEYKAVCSESGCNFSTGWTTQDDANKQAKDHEREKKGHKWDVRTRKKGEADRGPGSSVTE